MPTYDSNNYKITFNNNEFSSSNFSTSATTLWNNIYKRLMSVGREVDCDEEQSILICKTDSQTEKTLHIRRIRGTGYSPTARDITFYTDDAITTQFRVFINESGGTMSAYSQHLTGGHWLSFYEITSLAIVSKSFFALMGANIEVQLYQLNCESNRVDKSGYIVSVGTIYGSFKEVTSITSPSIVIERDLINFNYVYIPQLSRWYYVEEVVSIRNRLWQVSLKVDVLMTYKDKILLQKAYIARNETYQNAYLIDSERLMSNEPFIEILTASNDLFDVSHPEDIYTNFVINYYE